MNFLNIRRGPRQRGALSHEAHTAALAIDHRHADGLRFDEPAACEVGEEVGGHFADRCVGVVEFYFRPRPGLLASDGALVYKLQVSGHDCIHFSLGVGSLQLGLYTACVTYVYKSSVALNPKTPNMSVEQIARECAEFLNESLMEEKNVGLMQVELVEENQISIVDEWSNCKVVVYNSQRSGVVFNVSGIVRDNSDDVELQTAFFNHDGYAGFDDVSKMREVRRLVYKFFVAKKQM